MDFNGFTPEEILKLLKAQQGLDIGQHMDTEYLTFQVPMNDIYEPVDEGAEMFADILYEMLDLYVKKNADYGGAFDESLNEDGLLVVKIRLMDKIRRFSTLINSEANVKEESIEDTLIDLANYSVMALKWVRQNKE